MWVLWFDHLSFLLTGMYHRDLDNSYNIWQSIYCTLDISHSICKLNTKAFPCAFQAFLFSFSFASILWCHLGFHSFYFRLHWYEAVYKKIATGQMVIQWFFANKKQQRQKRLLFFSFEWDWKDFTNKKYATKGAILFKHGYKLQFNHWIE